MQQLNRKAAAVENAYPEVILQFGGGNFLRAFADWIIDVYNEKRNTRIGVLVATTTPRQVYTDWDSQDGLYHLITQGIRNGVTVDETRLIRSVSRVIAMESDWEVFLETAENPATRYVFSNTTEAGIRFSADDQRGETPPREFPAKLTLWLYRRYQHFKGAASGGCVFFPAELIDNNGDALRDCLLRYREHWHLEPAFAEWIRTANHFCNSLVDRIVPGIGPGEIPGAWEGFGFQDRAATQGEPYHLWAIAAPEEVQKEIPLDQLGLNVVFTNDLAPYRLSKVRILNGAHTFMVPVGLLAGLESVGEAVDDDLVGPFIGQAVYDEIIPTLDLPEIDLEAYADAVFDRFRNPFLQHRLISISLNSVAKFRERVLPSLLAFAEQKGALPPALCLSFASLIQVYRGSFGDRKIPINDEAWATDFMRAGWEKCDGSPGAMTTMVGEVLGWERAWNRSLAGVPGLRDLLARYLLLLNSGGVKAALAAVNQG